MRETLAVHVEDALEKLLEVELANMDWECTARTMTIIEGAVAGECTHKHTPKHVAGACSDTL